MAQSFPNLFSPVKIGNLLLKNRLAMAPMSLNYSTETGRVVQRQIDYFVERARGGVGMIVSESNYVSLEGRGAPRRVGIYADDMVPEHRRLVEAVHRENVPIIAELHHSGRATGAGVIGQYPVSASAVQLMVNGEPYVGTIPRTLTIAEIESLVEQHNQAARRAIEAGYDGVLVHAGHGYLLHQFLSPRTNKRTDRYGGSEENRARFLVDIVRALRESMAPETPILVRLTGAEHTENGYGVDFISRVARWLENAGASSINISSGAPEELEYLVGPRSFPEGFNVPLAARVKAEVKLPISVVGRIKGLQMADTIIAEGKADQLWIGRPLIADPCLPSKAREGRLEEIRECLACNHCLALANQGVGVECSVNAEVGREAEMRLVPAARPRRVLVVGGGPGGMEAARIAAERGHSVTLVEKRSRLGGQVLLGAAAPHSVEMERWARYLEHELHRTGVKVLADTEATPQLLEELRPETVVVATGAKPAFLEIPGSGMAHVFNAHEVLRGQCDDRIGRQVVVIGGGLTGVYAAEYLLERDREVSIVEMQDRLMADGNFIEKKVLTLDLCEHGVVVLVSTTVEAITSQGVLVTRAGRRELVPTDSVVISVGVRPERSLLAQLNVDEWDVHVIGDALAPRRIPQAVQEGARIGRLV